MILFSVCLLLLAAGVQSASGQEAVKSKKEREETVGRELGLDSEKSAVLVARLDEYRARVSAVMGDTALRPQQRSLKIRALAEEQRSALKQLLSPAQQEKMAAAIAVRNGSKSQQQRQRVELRVPGKNGRLLPKDSTKVTPRN